MDDVVRHRYVMLADCGDARDCASGDVEAGNRHVVGVDVDAGLTLGRHDLGAPRNLGTHGDVVVGRTVSTNKDQLVVGPGADDNLIPWLQIGLQGVVDQAHGEVSPPAARLLPFFAT